MPAPKEMGAGAECLCSSVQGGKELIMLLFLTTSPGLLQPPQSCVFLLPHRSTWIPTVALGSTAQCSQPPDPAVPLVSHSAPHT